MEVINTQTGPSFEQQHEVLTNLTSRLLITRDIVEILSLVTESVYHMLGYEDCVIYLLQNNKLSQWVAAGPKQSDSGLIDNPLVLSVGEGIVGAAAAADTTQLITDTSSDPRYITDDQCRGSELAVPILSNGRCIGVIDSEHKRPGFYSERDAEMLEAMAAIVALPLNQALNGYHHTDHRQHDIEKANQALDTLTSTDHMTGIRNRRAFTNWLEVADAEGQEVCCAAFDMDEFKQINDTYGHHAGDEAILIFVQLLREHFPHAGSQRILARLGGDEFGVLCPISEITHFTAQIKACITDLQRAEFSRNGEPIRLSGSGGVAFGAASSVWLRADEALYRAKVAGKNRVSVDTQWIGNEPQRLAS